MPYPGFYWKSLRAPRWDDEGSGDSLRGRRLQAARRRLSMSRRLINMYFDAAEEALREQESGEKSGRASPGRSQEWLSRFFEELADEFKGSRFQRAGGEPRAGRNPSVIADLDQQ